MTTRTRPPEGDGPPADDGKTGRVPALPAPSEGGDGSGAGAGRLKAIERLKHPWMRLAAGMLVVGLVLGYGVRAAGPTLHAIGPAQDADLNRTAFEESIFRVQVEPEGALSTATLTLNGEDVTSDARVVGNEISYQPPDFRDGEHEIKLSVDRPFVPFPSSTSWNFTLDRVRPEITFDPATGRAGHDEPVTLVGEVSEDVRLTANDEPIDMDAGRFELAFEAPPTEPIVLRARDEAGNAAGVQAPFKIDPRLPPEPVRSLHMSAVSWATPSLKGPIMKLLDEGVINAIQLDLKDESGIIGYDSDVALGREIGAIRPEYQLDEAVEEIHERGGRVIGRVVAFRDPILARHAWENGQREQVIQNPQGQPFAASGYTFTNFANEQVRQYNLDVSLEAAERGVDEILYDYIRRPDGPLDSMVFPGLKGGAQKEIADYLGEVREELKPTGAFLGASLFGVAATRPDEIAQNVGLISRNVDYIAPLVYPSGWGPGEYGVESPSTQPLAIVQASVGDFVQQTEGSGARVVPWLQDFTLDVPYTEGSIRAQIEGAKLAGVDEWIFWDPEVTYTTDGLR
ncbi:MAG: putative glycoside hydrolase [Miltoncostaeaceae bacterium]